MPIGNGPDIEQFNRKEEEQIRLQDKVEKWWYSLDDNYKYELLESYYPDGLNLMEMDEAWNGLNWDDKWDIYAEVNGIL